MFKAIKTKTGLLCMSFGLLLSLMGGDCGGTTTNNDCKAPKMTCGGKCIDVNTVSDCGACGTKCDAGAACVQDTSKKDGKFMCQAPCAAGEGRCDGKCVSLSADTNCGACGTVCTDKQKCGNHNGADTNSCLLVDDQTCKLGTDCFGGACTSAPKVCREAAGYACVNSKQCASGKCSPSSAGTPRKCLEPITAICTTHDECASGSCVDGKCATAATGTACRVGFQCASGICSGEDFKAGKCLAAIGDTCAADADCGLGTCINNNCFLKIGDACTDSSTCVSNNCDTTTSKCGPGLVAWASPCTRPGECASKNCASAFTTGLEEHKNDISKRNTICTGGTGFGETCTKNSDCIITGSHQMVCSSDGKCLIVSGSREEAGSTHCLDGDSSSKGKYDGGPSGGDTEAICAGAATGGLCLQDAGCADASAGATCDCGTGDCALVVPPNGTFADATAGTCKAAS